jgi:hypothetical protein
LSRTFSFCHSREAGIQHFGQYRSLKPDVLPSLG